MVLHFSTAVYTSCDHSLFAIHQIKLGSKTAMGKPGFRCEFCSKLFNSRMKLKGHIRLLHQHTQEKKHQEGQFTLKLDNLSDEEKIATFDKLKQHYSGMMEKGNQVEKRLSNLQERLKKLERKKDFRCRDSGLKTKSLGLDEAKGTYDFFEDETVPEGWKSCTKEYGGAFSNKKETSESTTVMKKYWAPNGRFCTSRREAILYMKYFLKSSEEDLEKMKDGLLKDGWVKYDIIDGWYSLNKEGYSGTQFITDKFKHLKSTKVALAYLIKFGSDKNLEGFIAKHIKPEAKNVQTITSRHIPAAWRIISLDSKSHVYISPDGTHFSQVNTFLETLHKSKMPFQEKEQFQKFLIEKGLCKKSVCKNFGNEVRKEENFAEDDLLPKCLKNSTNKSLVDDKGRSYTSARQAFKALCQDEETSEEDIEQMRTYLCKKLDWKKADDLLPKNWLTRKSGSGGKIEYLTEKGECLVNVEAAVTFMKDNGYSEADIENFKENGKTTKFSSDPNAFLPEGWKISDGEKRRKFMDQNGKIFQSRSSALRHMTESSYNSDDIKIMKNGLEYDGWQTNELLPPNWLVKPGAGNIHKSCFMNLDNFHVIYTSTSMRDYIKQHFDEETSNNFNNLKEKLADIKQPDAEDLNRSSYEWYTDQSIPDGWKMASVKHSNGKNDDLKVFRYLSPSGTIYHSRARIIKHMKSMDDVNEADLEFMITKLHLDDWKTNSNLPDGWYYRYRRKNMHFLTEKFDQLKAFSHAQKFMADEGYSEDLVNKFEDFKVFHQTAHGLPKSETVDKMKEEDQQSAWQENSSLPSGWKQSSRKIGLKNNEGYMPKYLSPDGKEMHSKVLILKQVRLHHDDYSEEDRGKAMKLMEHDGWTRHESFPEDWMVRSKDNLYLSPKCDILRSCKKAIQYMEDNDYDTSVVDKVKSLVCKRGKGSLLFKQNKKLKIENTDDEMKDGLWKKDTSLPSDWRLLSSGGDEVIQSDKGEMFSGRKEAIDFMIKEKFSPEDIFKLWNTLHLDGWLDDAENLPTGWKKKRFSDTDTYHYLSPLMEEVTSKNKLLDIILGNESDYSKSDIAKVKRWIH